MVLLGEMTVKRTTTDDMDDKFVIHLASNGSARLHPDNHSSAFTNVLSEPIHLDPNENYEVALVNIHMPKEYYIISKEDPDFFIEIYNEVNEFVTIQYVGVFKCDFDATNCDIPFIVRNLNDQFKDPSVDDDVFHYNYLKKRLYLTTNSLLAKNDIVYMKFSPKLADVLGFVGNTRYRLPKYSKKSDPKNVLEAPFPMCMSGQVQYVVVYSDIVKASHFADKKVNVLDIFTIGSDGNRGFHNVIYKPVNTNVISEISIMLADQEGKTILFKRNSGVTCSLLFRKRI